MGWKGTKPPEQEQQLAAINSIRLDPNSKQTTLFPSLPTQNITWVGLNWTDLLFTATRVISKKEKKTFGKHILTNLSLWYIHLHISALRHRFLNIETVFSNHAAAHKSFQFLPTSFIHNLSSNVCKKILYFVVLNMLSPTEKISGLEL